MGNFNDKASTGYDESKRYVGSHIVSSNIGVRGKRAENEDGSCTYTKLLSQYNTEIQLFGVFDGHGSSKVSKFLGKEFPRFFFSNDIQHTLLENYPMKSTTTTTTQKKRSDDEDEEDEEISYKSKNEKENYYQIKTEGRKLFFAELEKHATQQDEFATSIIFDDSKIKSKFMDIDKFIAKHVLDIYQSGKTENTNGGSTANVVLIINKDAKVDEKKTEKPQEFEIVCMNLGDSRAILSSYFSPENVSRTLIPLSDDHKPDRPFEEKRIQESGGHVSSFSSVARTNGDLSLSRAFADFEHKSNTLIPFEKQAISPVPEIRRLTLKVQPFMNEQRDTVKIPAKYLKFENDMSTETASVTEDSPVPEKSEQPEFSIPKSKKLKKKLKKKTEFPEFVQKKKRRIVTIHPLTQKPKEGLSDEEVKEKQESVEKKEEKEEKSDVSMKDASSDSESEQKAIKKPQSEHSDSEIETDTDADQSTKAGTSSVSKKGKIYPYQFIILGCDGLFETMTSEQAVQLVNEQLDNVRIFDSNYKFQVPFGYFEHERNNNDAFIANPFEWDQNQWNYFLGSVKGHSATITNPAALFVGDQSESWDSQEKRKEFTKACKTYAFRKKRELTKEDDKLHYINDLLIKKALDTGSTDNVSSTIILFRPHNLETHNDKIKQYYDQLSSSQ